MINWRQEKRNARKREQEEAADQQRAAKAYEVHQAELVFQMSDNLALNAHDEVVKDFLGLHKKRLRSRAGSRTSGESLRIPDGLLKGAFYIGPQLGHWCYLHGAGFDDHVTYHDWGRDHTGLYINAGAPFPTTDLIISCLAKRK